ncbi:GHKL domain-containing protein [Anaerobacillus sp. HL2]|nr:GHKL domain-containing protein [Anaerobacillus sp. HL2]
MFEVGFTTKSTVSKQRGFGLTIIKETINKYHGYLNIDLEANNKVVFHISFAKGEKKK